MEDQHPDHFFRVNRWTTHGGRKPAAKTGQIESRVDLPRQMIVEDRIAKMKLVG